MAVPSHWGQNPDLRGEESVLYRHRFEGPAVPDGPLRAGDTGGGRRWWLRLEGLAQQGDIWLDGAYLGHTDGYFVPHELEVTEKLAARSEHVLAIEATCRRFGDPDNRTLLTGALQDPELCGADGLIVGGVWRPVWLRSSGRVAIRHARAVCAEANTGDSMPGGVGGVRARVVMRVVLDVPGGGPVGLRTRVAGTEHVHSLHAAAGENRVEWSIDVADPPLWWPHALGDQRLCDLVVEAVAEDDPTVEESGRESSAAAGPKGEWFGSGGSGGESSVSADPESESSGGGHVHDRRLFRIGFRSVTMRRWVLHVNGERLFAKGANLLPTSLLPGAATASEVRADIKAARNAGLDLVRPVAHIARPELYDAADELGMLVWQDLPLRGLMNRGVATEARRQAREAVDLLGHRPSVAVWCAHDEPFPRSRKQGRTPAVVRRQGPSWNRDVLDRRLCRVIERCDGSRPVIPHTGEPPRFPLMEGTTSQLWFGLHGGRAADLGPVLRRVPAMGRFVSAFGTPVAEDQPEVVKTTIETLRRLKYRPTAGFLLNALADVAAGATADAMAGGATGGAANLVGAGNRAGEGFGLLDGLRRPKPGWWALVEACRPVIVVADPLPEALRPGDRLELAVHVVNDTRRDLSKVVARARVLGCDGSVLRDQRWAGAAPADGCAFVGKLVVVVPDNVHPGQLTVGLTLTDASPASPDQDGSPPIIATNRYTATVRR